MSRVPAELLREYVNSQKFSSTADIMEAMKDMFRDVLQQVMESELEEKLGYERARDCQMLMKRRGRKVTETGIPRKP
jgi:putative transposase